MTGQTKFPDDIAALLPPTLGKIGSVVFFATLFSLANPDRDGYNEFRKCHGNCINGILHAIGMPLAVSGVFLIVRSVADSAIFTRHIQIVVTTAYLGLYLTNGNAVSAISPWIFYIIYMSIFEFVLYQQLYSNPKWNRTMFLIRGITLIAVNVGALETIGHGVFEGHHSYVSEFFNSVFHTPLYGINSVLLSTGMVDVSTNSTSDLASHHVCW